MLPRLHLTLLGMYLIICTLNENKSVFIMLDKYSFNIYFKKYIFFNISVSYIIHKLLYGEFNYATFIHLY